MFADVIVNKPQDPTRSIFTYRIPNSVSKEIEEGHLIEVPWGKNSALGIVYKIKNTCEIPSPKEISKILFSTPLLLPYHIKLLKWMSWYYHAPLLTCLKAMLPEIPIKLIKERGVEFTQNQLRVSQDKPNDQSLNILAPSSAYSSPEESAVRVKSNLLSVKTQSIILVPNINQIPLILASLDTSKDIAIYHNELKESQKFDLWVKMLNGDFDIILGSRSAVFAPIVNLKEIRLIDEHSEVYKDQRSPYFNTQRIAAQISQILEGKLTFASQCPQVETFYFFQAQRNQKWKLSVPKRIQKPNIEIVDMLEEHKNGNYSPISDTLKNTLIQKVKFRKNFLLYLNRKTEAGYLFCPQCFTTDYSKSVPISCPNCQNPMVKFYSLNLQKIYDELHSLLPNVKASIIDASLKVKTITPLTLATSTLFYSIVPEKFDLIGVISADTVLNFPDYKSAERTFQNLTSLSNFLTPNGKMLIQTKHPNHPAIVSAAKNSYLDFYKEEIKSRKDFEFPPFVKLAKLSISEKNEELAQNIANGLFSKIRNISPKVEVLGPYPSFIKLPKKVIYNIILKGRERKNFDEILEQIPANWTVNIDPKDTL